ncbi:MAG: ribosome biogenesis GTP-binding protein YihA/YsxC [Erysipelotrichaceae bacterium]|nr:ribosome biogenesis GTP-binding protein YihA/YsxC [Erysipelotrichaceae bacterium]
MISFISSATKLYQYPESQGEVVFVGRSNVGKSSLINALYGKIAYVGKTPGKTRLLNFFNVNNKYTVCDVPGYGYARRSDKEIIEFGQMMDEYFTQREALRLCVLILDIRRVPNQDDIDMYNYLKDNNIPVLVVANKSDKFSNNQLIKQKKIICETLSLEDITCISTLKRSNIVLVAEKIESQVV